MKRTLTLIVLVGLGVAAGIGVSEFVYRSVSYRDAIGHLFGRGQLLALVAGHGIYEIDLQGEAEADSYLTGFVSSAANRALNPALRREILKRLVANENLRQISKKEAVLEADLERELDLLRFQFVNEKAWVNAIGLGAISAGFLREQLRADLRARRWIDYNVGSAATVNDASCRAYYAAHSADFAQPLRLRATHLFLAAPAATPADIVEAKRRLMDSLVARIIHGEQFTQLVWEASEDEATKPLGGDLNYFSSWRMPSQFFAAVSQLKVGEMGKPFRSDLGFHVVQLTDFKPVRELPFDEVGMEIAGLLTNRRRQMAVQSFGQEMSNRAEYVRQ